MNNLDFDLTDLKAKDLKDKGPSAAIASGVAIVIYFSYVLSLLPQIDYKLVGFIFITLAISYHRIWLVKKNDLSHSKFFLLFTLNNTLSSICWGIGILYLNSLVHSDFIRVTNIIIIFGLIAAANSRLQCSARDYYLFSFILLMTSFYLVTPLAHDNVQLIVLFLVNIVFYIFLIRQHTQSYKNWLTVQLKNLEMQKIIDTFPGGLSVIKNDIYVWVNRFISEHILTDTIDIKNKSIYDLNINKEFKNNLLDFINSDDLEKQVEILLDTKKGLRNYIIFYHRESLKRNSEVIITSLDVNDVTEMKKDLEKQKKLFFDHEKLASLGEMAAGLAHEINNPLAIISTKLQLLEKKIKKITLNEIQENLLGDLQVIQQTTNRISVIIKGLKSYSYHAENEEFTMQSLKSIFQETMPLCQEKFKSHGVVFENYFYDSSGDIKFEVRPVQFSQVLLNALNNSFDAIKNQEEKKIKLESWVRDNQLEIHITDNGPGIPVELREKIMEAFVTTKPQGEGTGLGLSISQRIITQHNGKIYFDFSKMETCLVIKIPLRQGQILFFSQSS